MLRWRLGGLGGEKGEVVGQFVRWKTHCLVGEGIINT